MSCCCCCCCLPAVGAQVLLLLILVGLKEAVPVATPNAVGAVAASDAVVVTAAK